MEKKWFIHADGRQEGPLALEEIKNRLAEGRLTTDSLTWCEGMPAWKKIHELDVFKPEQKEHKPEYKADELSALIEIKHEPTEAIDLTKLRQVEAETAQAEKLASKAEKRFEGRTSKKKSLINKLGLISAILLIAAGVGYVGGVFEMIFPTFPKVEDLTHESYEELKRIAGLKPTDGNIEASIAVSTMKSDAPVLYLASPVPDGTSFEIKFYGIPFTLLGTPAPTATVELSVNVLVSKRLGRTEPIRTKEGSAMPSGEYRVRVLHSADQKIVLEKTLLLLGSLQAHDYGARVKEMQAKFRERTLAELVELELMAASLMHQFVSARKVFGEAVVIQVAKKKAKHWDGLYKSWKSEDARIGERLQNGRDQKYFYARLYQNVRDLWQISKHSFDSQDSYMKKTSIKGKSIDKKASASALKEIQDAMAKSVASAEELQKSVARAKDAWKKASGLPLREGL